MEKENAKIKQELESANAQISSLREKMSIKTPTGSVDGEDLVVLESGQEAGSDLFSVADVVNKTAESQI